MSQCSIMDSQGNRCKGQVRGLAQVFLDPEMYPHDLNWVLLPVCEKHKQKFTEDGDPVVPTTAQTYVDREHR